VVTGQLTGGRIFWDWWMAFKEGDEANQMICYRRRGDLGPSRWRWEMGVGKRRWLDFVPIVGSHFTSQSGPLAWESGAIYSITVRDFEYCLWLEEELSWEIRWTERGHHTRSQRVGGNAATVTGASTKRGELGFSVGRLLDKCQGALAAYLLVNILLCMKQTRWKQSYFK